MRIRASGYALVGITLAVAVAAVNTGNNLFYLLASVLLSLIAVSGLASYLNLKFLKLEVTPPEEAFAGVPTLLNVRLKSRFISFLVSVAQERPFLVVRDEEGSVWWTPPRRGTVYLDRLEVSSSFPFGFFVRSRAFDPKLKILVYPKPVPGRLFFLKEEAAEGGSAKGGFDELFGVKRYVEGEPASLISWKASSKWNELFSKDLRGQRERPIYLVIKEPEEGLLSAATHFLTKELPVHAPVGLVLRNETTPALSGIEHRRRLLELLALA